MRLKLKKRRMGIDSKDFHPLTPRLLLADFYSKAWTQIIKVDLKTFS